MYYGVTRPSKKGLVLYVMYCHKEFSFKDNIYSPRHFVGEGYITERH